MKLNILITGSFGFIGTHLRKELGNEYSIDCWDIKHGKDIFDGAFEASVEKTDIVYHLAAETSVDKSFTEKDKVFMTNVLGTARVAYLCAKYKKKLIYPSSGAIHHKELSPYAYAKWLGEEIVKGIMDTTPVVILRLFNVFGPGMSKESGSIMYNFLHDAELTIYGDGEQKRDFIHVTDVVRIMKAALQRKWDGYLVEVGTGQSHTINYVAGLFAHFQEKNIVYKPPKREIKWSIADTWKLKRIYKRKLMTNLEKNIKDLCNQ